MRFGARGSAGALLALSLAAGHPVAAQPVGTAFTYQGQLNDAGTPANGPYDFELRLFDSPAGTNQVGPVVTVGDVAVANGLFTVSLDFGAVFTGNKRWLEIRVRPGPSSGGYTILSPLQELSPSPNAVSVPWTGLTAVPAGFADGIDNDSGGDILGVTAGTGLTGGGTTGTVTLNVNFAGSGAAATASRTDHDHFGQTWGPLAAADGLRIYNNSGTVGAAALTGDHLGSSTEGYGVWGRSSSSSAGIGVLGTAQATSGTNFGVYGETYSTTGYGVYGRAAALTGSTVGVYGAAFSPSGNAVWGNASATGGGATGVYGLSASTSGYGMYGRASAATGTNYGVYGETFSTAGYGVYGVATPTSGGAIGVYGQTNAASVAVRGLATRTSGVAYGVSGQSNSPSGYGVFGYATASTGFNQGVGGRSDSSAGAGTYGLNIAAGGTGLWGYALDSNSGTGAYGAGETGVWGHGANASSLGIYGTIASGGEAGRFVGNVTVLGTLSKTAGSFKIDHPLDPENKYLVHSFVESPDMMNVYNGNVVLDARGEAAIELPEWFEALNRDFRYQLTAIGAPGPGLHVAAKVQGNRFRIGGGSPGLEVSWQVTGIRQDAYAEKHRIQVEVDKPGEERGTYLHPEEHGAPKEKGREYKLGPKPPQLPESPEPSPSS